MDKKSLIRMISRVLGECDLIAFRNMHPGGDGPPIIRVEIEKCVHGRYIRSGALIDMRLVLMSGMDEDVFASEEVEVALRAFPEESVRAPYPKESLNAP